MIFYQLSHHFSRLWHISCNLHFQIEINTNHSLFMKILHTSDWHLGHTLYGFDRTEEQSGMLNQMEEIVKKHRPDVFLICGDVYHTSQPSNAVQTMFANALVRIHNANPEMAIVITAGNHDSATKHDIFRTPWRVLNVFTIGNISTEAREGTNYNDHIIEIPGKGFILAVPYVSERNMPDMFYQHLLEEVEKRNTENLPVVLTAHTTVRGCDITGHDSTVKDSIGGIDYCDVAQFGSGYDYLALGHIHKSQYVHTEKHNVRYCGTPLPISFDECFEHSITMVEIEHHGKQPIYETFEISNPHPLVTLPSQGFETWENAKSLLEDFPDNIPAYIRLNVMVKDFLPSTASSEAAEIAKNKKCRFCYINAHRNAIENNEATGMTIQEFKAEDPLQIAKRYAADSNKLFDEDMEDLFKEVLQLIDEKNRD